MLELELRLEDHRGGGLDREAHHDREPVHMEEGHDREHPVLAVPQVREPGTALQRVRDERAVRQHRALRDSRRAAGVLEHREVVRPGAGVEARRRRGEHLAEGDRAGIARERLAVPVLLLAREREEDAQDRRHLLLDVRDDHVRDAGSGPGRLHHGVEP